MMKHNEFTPFEYGLTEMHENLAVLSLQPRVNPKKAQEIKGPNAAISPSKKSTTRSIENEGAASGDGCTIIRPGPIDDSNVFVESEFANIYLVECKVLACCYANLCNIFHEIRKIDLTADDNLLHDHIAAGESALKLLRYTYNIRPSTRVSILLSVGRTRRTSALNNVSIEEAGGAIKTLLVEGIPTPVYPYEGSLEAFKKAFKIAFEFGNLWDEMRTACLEVAECYGNQRMFSGMDPVIKLKSALIFTLASIKITAQKNIVSKGIVSLSSDKSFAAPLPVLILVISIFIIYSRTFSYLSYENSLSYHITISYLSYDNHNFILYL